MLPKQYRRLICDSERPKGTWPLLLLSRNLLSLRWSTSHRGIWVQIFLGIFFHFWVDLFFHFLVFLVVVVVVGNGSWRSVFMNKMIGEFYESIAEIFWVSRNLFLRICPNMDLGSLTYSGHKIPNLVDLVTPLCTCIASCWGYFHLTQRPRSGLFRWKKVLHWHCIDYSQRRIHLHKISLSRGYEDTRQTCASCSR